MAKPLRQAAPVTATVTALPVAPAPKSAAKSKTPASKLTSRNVLAWLAKHPSFLNDNAEHLSRLTQNPKNVKITTNLLSLHAVQAKQAQQQAQKLTTRQQRLVATAQANAEVARHIFTAALQVMQLNTLAQLRTWLQTSLPHLLELNATRFYLAGTKSTTTTLTVAEILTLAPQPVTLRSLTSATERHLYGPKGKLITSDALLRLDDPLTGTPLALVALGSTDATRYHAGQSTELAAFLGQALAIRVAALT